MRVRIVGPLRLVVKECVKHSAVTFVDVLDCGHTVLADPNRDVTPRRRRCKQCAPKGQL